MDILEGAAAFAVAMIIFSTVVTGLVELGLRTFATRPKILAASLEKILENEIWPRFKDQLTAIAGDQDPDTKSRVKTAFLHAMIRNPVSTSADPVAGQAEKGYLSKFSAEVESLSTYAFLQRLAKTEIGEVILRQGEAEARTALQDLSRTFERYGAASSEVFRRKAGSLSVVVAIALALVINIDAGRLFDHLMNSPVARSALIDRVEVADSDNQKALGDLRAVIVKLEHGEDVGVGSAPEFKKEIADLKASLEPLTENADLPIGFGYFPHCKVLGSGSSCSQDRSDKVWLASVLWLANALLAGVLIGLGGPFWFRIYSALSQLVQLARVFSGAGREKIDENAKDQPASNQAMEKEDIVKIFRTAGGPARRRVDEPVNPPAG